jgi:hypothetical protein
MIPSPVSMLVVKVDPPGYFILQGGTPGQGGNTFDGEKSRFFSEPVKLGIPKTLGSSLVDQQFVCCDHSDNVGYQYIGVIVIVGYRAVLRVLPRLERLPAYRFQTQIRIPQERYIFCYM